MGTDKDWEKWGAIDPYFGVLSSDEFHASKLNTATRQQFFDLGRDHIERIVRTIRDNFDSDFRPVSALDFGCGVGRLVIPIAALADNVVGVDVSSSMLAEAAKNCNEANIQNVDFIEALKLYDLGLEFELVHSFIVFQHISWRRGRILIQELSERVKPGGYLAIHVFTSCKASRIVRWLVQLRYIFPPLNWMRNVVRNRPIFEPAMQLHVYDLKKIASDLVARKFGTPLLIEEPTGSDFDSAILFARRRS